MKKTMVNHVIAPKHIAYNSIAHVSTIADNVIQIVNAMIATMMANMKKKFLKL